MDAIEHLAERLQEHERVEMLAIQAQNKKISDIGTKLAQVYDAVKGLPESLRRLGMRMETLERRAAVERMNGTRPLPSLSMIEPDEITSHGTEVFHLTNSAGQRLTVTKDQWETMRTIADATTATASAAKAGAKDAIKWAVRAAIVAGFAALTHLIPWLAGGGLHRLLGP